MKGISRLRDRAQTTSEYAMILALVAVICIAALTLLGKNINALLAGFGGSMPKSQSVTPPGGNNTTAVASTTTAAVPTAATATAATTTAVGVSMDASTGQIQLSNLDSGTSGKITTSSQGTELAALALQRLAKTALTDDGQPPDPVSLGLIQKLADLGHSLASEQSSITLPPPANSKASDYLSSATYSQFYYSGMLQTADTFYNTYAQLDQLIGSNPRYSNIMSQVQDYAGLASSITHQNYIAEYNPAATASGVSNSIQGTNYATNPANVQFDPADIHTAMTSMSQLSKQ